ncbi:LysR family transcriptional regulator [Cupriavidus taiwanensis]|uniref:Transcriptional regulator LysR family n=1 Tax=Cupriavidus taiwanensis TaxID=164546 RepID=A0A7Z7NQN6_9BURK|nr:LysR family transcriptional regulator [Cupriavidus taiwanensis]SOZ19507.1 Transcriptional regulator LysR family [Cupriavidus taiwanensis]SOZ97306.1 Transcriptional regulator LysR family [Cupriavidus taiwanensis]SPC26194.1 Transcriptional regulator LysR family [Cupriavidus taiwanensis]SPD37671.1 Transcriptional regulator LysR family [Cupriavidus taiwanensis]
MTTFRELEAFVAVADTGSFERAARSLATSQSNVSRLISDFEGTFQRPLLNREQRSARLTLEGQEVLRIARDVLRQRANLTERFGDPDLVTTTLRLGVTELAALTWLGRFLAQLRERYARIRVELEVGNSTTLHTSMRDGRLDIAIVADVIRSIDMARLPVGSVKFGWYCASTSGLSDELTLSEFEHQTLLIQGSASGAGSLLSQWLVDKGIRAANIINSDSLAALAGICAAGLGLASLPRAVALDPVERGVLREVNLSIGAPEMKFIALVRIDAISAFHRAVAQLASESCDFTTPFHRTRPQSVEPTGGASC